MTLNIIEHNYIFRHRYFTIYKLIGIFYFYFLLSYTSGNSDNSFLEYKSLIKTFSLIFMFTTFILILINNFIYYKGGHIKIDFELITITKNDWTKTIDLNKIKSIRVEKNRGKEYTFYFDNLSLNIELSELELKSLKNLKTIAPFDFGKPDLIERIKYHFKTFATKNKSFMDEPYRK
ncbi:hypothetical protein [Tenacibaculum geojense]|uniref:Uncharacterized protein n=1 Tax=Tenacibaculum geojense TaxID=915352 RepID=A0ABW3JMB0_9FLAO